MTIQVTILDKKADAQLITDIKAEVLPKIEGKLPAFKKAYLALEEFEDKMARKYFQQNADQILKSYGTVS